MAGAQLLLQLPHIGRRGVVRLLGAGGEAGFQVVQTRQHGCMGLAVLGLQKRTQLREAGRLGLVGQFALRLQLFGVATGFEQH